MEGGVSAFNARPVGKRQALLAFKAIKAKRMVVDGYLYRFTPPRERTKPDWNWRSRSSSPSGETVGAGDVDLGNQFKIDARLALSAPNIREA